MPRHRTLTIVLASAATLLAYVVVVLGTFFAACGLFGCSGGKAAYSPVAAQIGLLLCGLVLVPLVLLLAGRTSWPARVGWGLGAVALGALIAMAVLDLGPHGCPASQTRATAGPSAFNAGSPTCSGDHDAVL